MAVTIPSNFVKLIGIRAGDEVKLEMESEKAKVSYFFSGMQQLPLYENFLKIKKVEKK